MDLDKVEAGVFSGFCLEDEALVAEIVLKNLTSGHGAFVSGNLTVMKEQSNFEGNLSYNFIERPIFSRQSYLA